MPNVKTSLIVLLLLQFAFCVVVFFNIPILRQVIGFLYVTFIPGYVVLKLLKIGNLGALQTVLFSSGLSIALLMFLGFVASEFGILVGFFNVLSTLPLMLVLNLFTLVGGLAIYLRKSAPILFGLNAFKFSGKTPLMLLLVALPVLSVVGARWENFFNSSLVLLFVILTIAILMALSISYRRFLPTEFYLLVILSIALALLFHHSLISNYVHGPDIQIEYTVFSMTQSNGFWNQVGFSEDPYDRFNGMLSITVLPTIYSNLLNMDGTWVFQILFPLIFSLVPLGLFECWHPNFGKENALIAAFLFMSQLTFYTEMISLARQMIAELFFVLLLLLILNKQRKESASASICFIMLGFGLTVSHYSLALVFLFLISFAWIFFRITRKKSFHVSSSLILLLAAIMFAWYLFTSDSSVLTSISFFGTRILSNLGEFLNPASRGSQVLQGLGMEAANSQWVMLSRILAYITEFFILFGFVFTARRVWRSKFALSLSNSYFVLSSGALMILMMCIIVPAFAGTLNMARFYHITLFFLAPFFVVGSVGLTSLVVKHKTELTVSLLLATLIASYFLFQTGFVYEVVKEEPTSFALSGYRMDRTIWSQYGYLEEVNVVGAQWVHAHVDSNNLQLFADSYSRDGELTSYGNIPEYDTISLTNTTTVPIGGIVYLSKSNVVYGKIAKPASGSQTWNISELKTDFSDMSKIYTNGGCQIYINTGGG
jgi:uncharacterized membrane protein